MVALVTMPALSPTMTEGKIVVWNKKVGDNVNVGDVMLEVETDKAVMEVEAQNKGTIGKILCELNSVVSVGEPIALILEKGETEKDLDNFSIPESSNSNSSTNNKDDDHGSDVVKDGVRATNDVNVSNINSRSCRESGAFSVNNDSKSCVFASPLAKNIANMNSIDISQVASLGGGSGPNGRIVKADVEKFLSSCGSSIVASSIGRNPVEFVDVEPDGMRATIASRLAMSKQQVPHWYMKISANMSKLVSFREELNKMAKNVNGVPEYKISVNDVIVMVVARALHRRKDINASWIDGKIRKYNNVDVSVACSVNGGVITPIVKNADQKGLLELSAEIKKLVLLARDGNLSPNDYTGGSITISNLGMYGVREFSSIINPPQSCIVAVGAIEDSVVIDEHKNICICPVCNITISADHRVIDGSVLASFASELKLMLENPTMIVR